MTTTSCKLSFCSEPKRANGFCTSHNARFKRTGDPGGPIVKRQKNAGKTCSAPDCKDEAKKKGFCYAHYERDKTHGVLEGIYNRPHQCLWEDCTELATAKGYCPEHRKLVNAEYTRKYYVANREKVIARTRARYDNNREWYKSYQHNWYQLNKEEKQAKNKAWLEDNPEFRPAFDARRKIGRYAGMDAEDRSISTEYRKAIAIDPCYYCGIDDLSIPYEVDHYCPIAMGGTDHWYNLVRSCRPCNRRKSGLHGDIFIQIIAATMEGEVSSLFFEPGMR